MVQETLCVWLYTVIQFTELMPNAILSTCDLTLTVVVYPTQVGSHAVLQDNVRVCTCTCYACYH